MCLFLIHLIHFNTSIFNTHTQIYIYIYIYIIETILYIMVEKIFL